MIDRKAPRSKINPGVGDVYANPMKPNLHAIIREAANGRVYITHADEKGPIPGGVSYPIGWWLADVEAAGLEYFKKGEVPKRNRPVPPIDESIEPWLKKDPEWVALKKFLGPKEYRRRFTGPEELGAKGFNSWRASWGVNEFKAVYAAWQDVRDSYYDMVGEAALNGEDSEEYAAAAKRNDEAVARIEAAYEAWFQEYRIRRVEQKVAACCA